MSNPVTTKIKSLVKGITHDLPFVGTATKSETCPEKTLFDIFFQSCDDGDAEVVQRFILKEGMDINMKNSKHHDWTALHYAASRDNTLLIALLIQHKADPTVTASNGTTPLQLARSRCHRSAVEALASFSGEETDVGLTWSMPIPNLSKIREKAKKVQEAATVAVSWGVEAAVNLSQLPQPDIRETSYFPPLPKFNKKTSDEDHSALQFNVGDIITHSAPISSPSTNITPDSEHVQPYIGQPCSCTSAAADLKELTASENCNMVNTNTAETTPPSNEPVCTPSSEPNAAKHVICCSDEDNEFDDFIQIMDATRPITTDESKTLSTSPQ
jgi:hypothetical protein